VLREQIRTTNNETDYIVPRLAEQLRHVYKFTTIYYNGQRPRESRGAGGKAKLKFRPGVSDRKEKMGTIEMTARIVGEADKRAQACYLYLQPKEFQQLTRSNITVRVVRSAIAIPCLFFIDFYIWYFTHRKRLLT